MKSLNGTGGRRLVVSAKAVLLLTASAALATTPQLAQAQAQAFDPASRSDVRDGRGFERERPGPGGAGRPDPWTVEYSAGGALTSNAAATPDNEIEAGYVTPGVKLAFTKAYPVWTVSAYAKVDADYYSTDPDDLDEARLDGRISLTRKVSGGTLGLRYRASAGYTSGFGEHAYTIHRARVDFSGTIGDRASYQIALEQHGSDLPGLRRTRLMVVGDYTWSTANPATTVTLEEALLFSDFQAGANEGRNDLLSQTSLSIDHEVDRWTIGFAVSLTRDFSNRDNKEFTAFEVGPTFRLKY